MKKLVTLCGFLLCLTFSFTATAQLKYENGSLLLNTDGSKVLRPSASSYFRGREFAFTGLYGRLFSIRIGSNGGAPVLFGSDGGFLGITDPETNAYQDMCLASIYNYADLSTMTDVRAVASATDAVMQMKPISYLPATQPPYGKGVIHPSNSNGRKLGFVAQDMMEILPEVVAHTGDSRYMIDYNSLIPLLVRTIQEQNARIVTLEQEVTALKNK